MQPLLSPQQVEIEGKLYVISKLPATAGREILSKYITTGLPKVGDYQANEANMFKLMAYVAAVDANGQEVRLNNKVLIDNHIPSWEVLMKLEGAMIEYNCSFFQNGKASTFLRGLSQKFQELTTETLMNLLRTLSQQGKQL